MMRYRLISCLSTAALLALPAMAQTPPQAPPNQPTAGSTGSSTATQGPAPNISPNDPAYSENGAPRAGQFNGQSTAGAPEPNGNYAPIQHPRNRAR